MLTASDDFDIDEDDLMEAHGFDLAALYWAALHENDRRLVRLVEAEVERRREMLKREEAPLPRVGNRGLA